jgi:hypothetical protein
LTVQAPEVTAFLNPGRFQAGDEKVRIVLALPPAE